MAGTCLYNSIHDCVISRRLFTVFAIYESIKHLPAGKGAKSQSQEKIVHNILTVRKPKKQWFFIAIVNYTQGVLDD